MRGCERPRAGTERAQQLPGIGRHDLVRRAAAATSPPPPPPGTGSSQTLIAQDLDAGLIDFGTSLIYRAWALFWDPRLPERYDGTGSTGEDQSLFPAIEAALGGLPTEQQAELEGFVARPTDARSPFGPAAAAPAAAARVAAAAAAPAPTKCVAPKQWVSMDWPDDQSDTGFRAWACDVSREAAQPVLTSVLAVGAKVWNAMTTAEPNGMGLPVPDRIAPQNDGNGKIDVYLLATNQCRDRNGGCRSIGGNAVASARVSRPCNGFAPDQTEVEDLAGFPPNACSGFMLLSRNRFDPANTTKFTADFAHEFFHILEYAHNFGGVYSWAFEGYHWYVEAAATWAEWYYSSVLGSSFDDAYTEYTNFQEDDESLLQSNPSLHPYASWAWPLFQTTERSPSNVFMAWSVAEAADDMHQFDAALAVQLPFDETFRDFAVRNLQPYEYAPPESSGLDADWWRAQDPKLATLPVDPHHLVSSGITLALGGAPTSKISRPADVKALAAQYERVAITDPKIRQITIDLGALDNTATANLDVVGRLQPVPGGPAEPWHRVSASGDVLTLCRDEPTENFDLLYVVISNESADRVGNGPDTDAAVKGTYTVESKDACAVPDHYDLTFSGFSATGDTWDGAATFDLTGAARTCDDPANFPPTADTVHYCYALVDGNAAWQYTESNGTKHATTARLSPSTDVGTIELRLRDPDPQKVRTYQALLAPNSGAHLLPTSGGQRDAADSVIAWVASYSMPPGGFVPIGGGYQLTNSAQLCADTVCQGWTWDFTPRWDAN